MMARTTNRLQKLSHYSTVLSSLAAIAAIIIGVWQFNIGLNRADKQLQYIEQDRKEHLVDTRPIVVIDSTSALDFNYNPFNSYQYIYYLSNIGTRSADSIKINSYVVATISEDNVDFEKFKMKSQKADLSSNEYITPLNKGLRIESTNFIMDPGLFKDYHIKTIISYYDRILKQTLNEPYYFSVDFDKTLIRFHYMPKSLTLSTKEDALKTDSLINLHFGPKMSIVRK